MGIFTRVRDIISSNVNAMLDKAEDPEKLVKLMIREMEDTLVEIKASCAGAMAAQKKVERESDAVRDMAAAWADKAAMAVDKGREALAREALVEKRRFADRAAALTNELEQTRNVITQYQSDIVQLEEKLRSAREKQRVLAQRHRHAQDRKRAETEIRRFDTSDAVHRFEQFEQRIDRMEADADLVNFGRKATLDEAFDALETDSDIERELADLKARRNPSAQV
jgi:phage shock protein A